MKFVFFFFFFLLFFTCLTGEGGANIVKDKANHAVILDKPTYDKLNKDVQTYRLITVAVLVDRLKINGSLARKALKELEEKGVIKQVVGHSKCTIYSTFFFFSCPFPSFYHSPFPLHEGRLYPAWYLFANSPTLI